MFGNLSYLFSVFIFTLPVILIEWIFFFHILKKQTFSLLITIIAGLVLVSLSEPLGLYMRVWQYGVKTTLPTFFLGTKLEAYVYVVFGSIAVGSAVLIGAFYEDKKSKNIFIDSLKDLFSAKYACWQKNL